MRTLGLCCWQASDCGDSRNGQAPCAGSATLELLRCHILSAKMSYSSVDRATELEKTMHQTKKMPDENVGPQLIRRQADTKRQTKPAVQLSERRGSSMLKLYAMSIVCAMLVAYVGSLPV